MNRLNKQQKDKVVQFRNITSASEKIATDCLKTSNWSVEGAIDIFYSSGLASTVSVDPKAIESLFAKYKDTTEDLILADGISRFCEDLNVDPADIVMLVISFHMNAATMCEFTKEEFTGGLTRLGCTSIEKLVAKLPELRRELQNDSKFQDVYNFAFLFAREKGQKCLQLDTAVGMWQLLFHFESKWPLVDIWCEFLQKHHNRAISKDTWTQLYEFTRTIKPDFSNFDENGAWPYLLDEFVEYVKSKG